jgi:hypothetical protein
VDGIDLQRNGTVGFGGGVGFLGFVGSAVGEGEVDGDVATALLRLVMLGAVAAVEGEVPFEPLREF